MSFREFEHAGWERATARYDEAFGRLTTQCIEPLLDAVSASRGVRLLDVASGPGYVAGAAAKRGAIVVGTDRTGALLRAQTPQALAAIRAEVTAQAATALPMPAVLASATKGSV